MVYALMAVHNRVEYTRQCIDALIKQSYKDLTVVVVDDGSIDETERFLAETEIVSKVIKGNGSLYWGGAMRKGVDYILSVCKEGDFVLLLNNDTVFGADFVNILVRSSIRYSRIPVGSILHSFKSDRLLYNSHKFYFGKATNRITKLSPDKYGVSFDSDVIHTKGTIVPVEIFQKVGNFSKLFPHYGGDYDFFHRVRKIGYKLAMDTKAITYTLNDDLNLSEKLRKKKSVTLQEFIDLFFSIRSSSNLYSNILQILLHAKSYMKLVGVFVKILYFGYFFITKVRRLY